MPIKPVDARTFCRDLYQEAKALAHEEGIKTGHLLVAVDRLKNKSYPEQINTFLNKNYTNNATGELIDLVTFFRQATAGLPQSERGNKTTLARLGKVLVDITKECDRSTRVAAQVAQLRVAGRWNPLKEVSIRIVELCSSFFRLFGKSSQKERVMLHNKQLDAEKATLENCLNVSLCEEGATKSGKTCLENLYQRYKQNPSSTALVELMYQLGKGIGNNDELSFKLSEKAAMSGHAKAMYYVGRMKTLGKGTLKNSDEATSWFRRAVPALEKIAASDPEAEFLLSLMLDAGWGCEKNHDTALSHLNAAATKGCLEAILVELFTIGLKQKSEKESFVNSIRPVIGSALKTRIDNKDLLAYSVAGAFLSIFPEELKTFIEKDFDKKYFDEFEKAHKAGDKYAAYTLSVIINGFDEHSARKWLKDAAMRGHLFAIAAFAEFAEKAKFDQDFTIETAKKLLEEPCKRNDPTALFAMSLLVYSETRRDQSFIDQLNEAFQAGSFLALRTLMNFYNHEGKDEKSKEIKAQILSSFGLGREMMTWFGVFL